MLDYGAVHDKHLSIAMDPKFAYLLPTGSLLRGYAPNSSGRPLRRQVLPRERPRGLAHVRRLATAVQERSQLSSGDRFEAHGLGEARLAQLQSQLCGYGLRSAHLVKKSLRLFPEQPLYVLLVQAQGEGTAPDPSLSSQIAQEIAFRGELLVCLVGSLLPPLEAAIQAVPRSALSLSAAPLTCS